MRDFLTKIPAPRWGDMGAHLIPGDAASTYAAQCIDRGIIAGVSEGALSEALTRAALFYVQGKGVTARWKAQGRIARQWRGGGRGLAAGAIRKPPRHRLRDWGDYGLIWIMALIWKGTAGHSKGFTAYNGATGRDVPSRFMRFCRDWIRMIDPERRTMPSRRTIRNVIADMRARRLL